MQFNANLMQNHLFINPYYNYVYIYLMQTMQPPILITSNILLEKRTKKKERQREKT